jgi:hypothetical protein
MIDDFGIFFQEETAKRTKRKREKEDKGNYTLFPLFLFPPLSCAAGQPFKQVCFPSNAEHAQRRVPTTNQTNPFFPFSLLSS